MSDYAQWQAVGRVTVHLRCLAVQSMPLLPLIRLLVRRTMVHLAAVNSEVLGCQDVVVLPNVQCD